MAMNHPDFDAIVAGAGPGGAAAAYYLGQAGLRVLVVEGARLPRRKACGGAIPHQALASFPFAFDCVIEAVPSRARFTYPGLPAVDVPLPDRPVAMVMRARFDAFLLACSQADVLDGVAVVHLDEDNERVQVQAGDRTLSAYYLVGADGALSTVARHLGLRRGPRLGGSLEAEVPWNGDSALQDSYRECALFALGAIPWGYAWVFPKADHLSVGIARFCPGRANLHLALRRAMDRLGISLEGVPLYGHVLPCYPALAAPFSRRVLQERLSSRRCLLVGDAAGLVDPLMGEGIRYAMISARLAAEAIAGGDLSGYEAAIWREIGHDLAVAGRTAQVYYNLPWLGFTLGMRNPAFVRQFADLLGGRLRYQGMGRRVVATTARWVLGIGT